MFIVYQSRVYPASNIYMFYASEQGFNIKFMNGAEILVSMRQRFAEQIKVLMYTALSKGEDFDIDSVLPKV